MVEKFLIFKKKERKRTWNGPWSITFIRNENFVQSKGMNAVRFPGSWVVIGDREEKGAMTNRLQQCWSMRR